MPGNDERTWDATMPLQVSPRPKAGKAPDAMRVIQLEVVGGPMDGQECRVERGELTIGRSPQNDLALPYDPLVSANHARIVTEGSTCWLEDLGSTNGTRIGEQKIDRRAIIGPGATFFVGHTQLELLPD